MSDVFKWIFATTLQFALTTSPMLMAQDAPPVENASAQQPAAKVPDSLNDPQLVAPPEATDSTRITLELPADPALVEPFRRMADAIAAKSKDVRIQEAGTSAVGPGTIEAELRLKPEVSFDVVEKLINDLARFGVDRARLSGSFEGQNMIVINAPANASWKLIHDLETYLAKRDGFRFDVRVRANDEPPTSTKNDASFPEFTPNELTTRTQSETEVRASTPANSMSELQRQEIRGKIAQLESERAELNTKFGNKHPTMRKQDQMIAALRDSFEDSQNPITVYYLRHAKADQVVGMIQLLYAGKADAIVADERSNSLFIRADDKQIKQIEKYIEILDQDVSPSSNAPAPTVTVDDEQLKIFRLQNSDANQTAVVIEQLFGGSNLKVAVDTRTNSLIVRSNEPLLQQIEAILLRLDEQPGRQAPIASSATGTTANSTITITSDPTSKYEPPIVPIGDYRRRLNELELPLLQLAEKVRSTEASVGKDHAESVKQRASLRESIQKTFVARQEIQRAELAEFTRRLQRMQQSLDARDRIADQIVDRRLEDLLNPNVKWDSTSPDAGTVQSNLNAAGTKTEEFHKSLVSTIRVKDWGPVNNGLRLAVIPTIENCPAEEPLEVRLVLKNDSEQQITLKDSGSSADIDTTIRQTSGAQVVTRPLMKSGVSRPKALVIAPQQALIVAVQRIRVVESLAENGTVEKQSPADADLLIVDPNAFEFRNVIYTMSCDLNVAVDGDTTPLSLHSGIVAIAFSRQPEEVSSSAPSKPFVDPLSSSRQDSGTGNSELLRKLQGVSDAEKAIGRLVLVFFEDKARRAVPALLIRHGRETIALTTSPATIVPENIEHAIDRTFLEFYDRENVPTTYADFSTPDLHIEIAKDQLTSFRLENPVAVKAGDVLSAILMHGQADFEVTPNAARVTAVDQKTAWKLPSHELNREFTGLIQIDQRLPEGTPLFKDGQLAGITLLGTRFMKDEMPGSYVVPASRILEVLQQLKTE